MNIKWKILGFAVRCNRDASVRRSQTHEIKQTCFMRIVTNPSSSVQIQHINAPVYWLISVICIEDKA